MITPGDFLNSLVPSIQEAGASVSSWIRSTKKNASVRGHKDSWHCVGLAVDVIDFFSGETKEKFIHRCQRLGYGVLDEGDHVHVQAIRASTTPPTT